MTVKETASAKAEMLIRRPVAEVFEAFVNPAITSNFWFTRGSGRLEAGKQVQWDSGEEHEIVKQALDSTPTLPGSS